MNIEDDLRDVASQSPAAHKAALRRQLVTHFDEATQPHRQQRARWLPYVLVPIGALSLLVAVNAFVPSLRPGDQPTIAQKIAGNLTSQQVFAIAIAKLQDVTDLKAGETFYVREYRAIHVGDKSSDGADCLAQESYAETYFNQDGIPVKIVSSNLDGKVYGVGTVTSGGKDAGDEYFYDKALAATVNHSVSCDKQLRYSPSYVGVDNTTPVASAKPPVAPALDAEQAEDFGSELMSGNPSRQKLAFEALQKSNDFIVEENKQLTMYGKPVVAVISEKNTLGWQAYYFDQATKQFVGYENASNFSIFLTQDIRQYKHDPQYVGPSPQGL